jgi:hypothetical protein
LSACVALQQMRGRGEPRLEEIDQRRLLRHRRQPRIGAHEEMLAGMGGEQSRPLRHLHLAVAEIEQRRAGGDALAQFVHHGLFELVGALGEGLRFVLFVHDEPACSLRACATASMASTIA